MNILLINTNPVVSRLFVLCTRDKSVTLHEISSVHTIKKHIAYELIFIDDASYGEHEADFLLKYPEAKKILLSYKNEKPQTFNLTIKKPFLPSQIIDVIQNTEPLYSSKEDIQTEKNLPIEQEHKVEPSIFPLQTDTTQQPPVQDGPLDEEPLKTTEVPSVLDLDEIDQIKSLLEMNDSIEEKEILSDEALEQRKIDLIKEKLIADGLEIVEEDQIAEELSLDLEENLNKSNKVKKKSTGKKKKKKKKKKSKKVKFTEKNLAHIEDAVEMAIATMNKQQMKKLLKGKKVKIHIQLRDYTS